jgi:hypothetical protein
MGNTHMPPALMTKATYKQSLDRVFRRAARVRRSNTPAVAIILVSNHKLTLTLTLTLTTRADVNVSAS